MAAPYTTPARPVTYRGVPALVWEIRRSKGGTTGRRIVATLWRGKAVGQPVEHEAWTLVLRDVQGDAWRRPDSFVCHAERTIHAVVSTDNARDLAAEFAAERWS